MQTFLATLALFGIVMAAMAIGVVIHGRRLRGSCGGPDTESCSCGPKKRQECRDKQAPHSDTPIQLGARSSS